MPPFVSSIRNSKLHHAWVILGAACVLAIMARADSASFAVFIDPLVEKFEWKRGDISFAYALAFLAGMPVMPMIGWLGDRLPRTAVGALPATG